MSSKQDRFTPEEKAAALRVAIFEIVQRARNGLENMGCHPDRHSDAKFEDVSRNMDYAKVLKSILEDITTENSDKKADSDRGGYACSKPEDHRDVSVWNGDGRKKLKPVDDAKIEPVKHEKTCRCGRTSNEGCAFYDKGICRGLCHPTYPPQYPECEFNKNNN